MTPANIPPCPACGTVPEYERLVTTTCCAKGRADIWLLSQWQDYCSEQLGRACRELSIETVEQLKARLAPDPRVAVLEIALTKVAESDLSQVPYSQIKAHIEEALFRSQFIAAQRGEG